MAKRKFFWWRETEAEPADFPKSSANLLSDRLAAGALSAAEALRYAIGMAEALRAVHASGRVFGNLQPAGVRLLDDGVELVPCGPSGVTPYCSPELLAGRDLDWRSDIFSLGAVLYEMLSGCRAFDGATKPALRFAILDHAPAPLQNVSPTLSQLVMRCLEKRPERRLQRMEILLAALKLQEIMATPIAGAAARGN